MVLIASLIELLNTQTWQKVNIQLANFDKASLRVIWFCWARFWVAGASKRGEPRAPVNGKESRSAEFSTVRSTVGQDFDAKVRNSAQRTAKAKLRITRRQQRYAKQ
jgi:hypothetical protein